MTPTTPILAPPYHVQSTTAELRFGFPYFGFHDSVPALWAQKWRKPCEQGIYPFTDAKVEDFDPIFAELVQRSGDAYPDLPSHAEGKQARQRVAGAVHLRAGRV